MNDTPMTEPDRDADLLDFLPIDPFAAQREAASKIVGLGGEQPAPEPGYVFQSLHIYPVPGPVRFTLHFHGLTASSGTLSVRLHAFSRYPGTAPMLQKVIVFPLKDVAAKGGIVIVELNSRRNMGYLIGGTIDDDTDARADALSLSLDPRERDTALVDKGTPVPVVEAPSIVPVEGWREKPELATISPVRFARPVSQAMTAGQCDDPLARAWNTVLHQEDCDAKRRWHDAFILQTLHHYGIAAKGGSCLGMGRENSRLPAYFANSGYAVLFAVLSHDTLPDADPGLALERLECPELCASPRFYEQVDLTLFDDLAIPPGLTGFDFLWSIDAPAHPDARNRFPVTLRDAMHCLKPGGLAIHVLRYSGQLDAPADRGSTSYGRAEIERMALSLVADGHDVAQLNFAIDRPTRPGEDLRLPFALVVRRTK